MSDPTEYPELDAALRLHHATAPEPDLAPIRREVLGRIAASDGKRTRNRKLVLATAALAVIAAVTTTVAVWPSAPQPSVVATADADAIAAITNAADAPATMNLLIERVAKAKPLNIAQGGYLYTSSRGTGLGVASGPDGPAYYWMDTVTEYWNAVDDSHRVRLSRSTQHLNARPFSEADRVKLEKYGSDYATVRSYSGDSRVDPPPTQPPLPPGLGNPTPGYLASLPTDPVALKALWYRPDTGPEPTADRSLFKEVAHLIEMVDALLTPELRSAIYQVIATLPGVERIPGQTDLAGRAGVAIAGMEHNKVRPEIIIDPVTSRAIGSRTVQALDDGPRRSGMVIGSSTTDQKIVEELGEK